MLTVQAPKVKTVYSYRVPFVHAKTGEVRWETVETTSDRFDDLRTAVKDVRLLNSLNGFWRVDFDDVASL